MTDAQANSLGDGVYFSRTAQMFWGKIKLTMPSMLGGRVKARPLQCANPALKSVFDRATPGLQSYERLAAIYHDYARSFCPDYVSFLRAIGAKYRRTFRSILDLACGAGTLTTQLASCATRVVGLDISEAMLNAARQLCRHQSNVELVHGDFRQFQLNERFDAIVCASDSLNYLHEPAELAEVLVSVAQHLHSGGLFTFDALDDRGLQRFADKFIAISSNGSQCYIVLRYDGKRRVENSLVVFNDAVELHRRVPIEPADVQTAAKAAHLALVDWFSGATFGLLKQGGIRNFYVLQKSEATSPPCHAS